MNRSIRTFIAVDIPDEIRERIAAFQDGLKQYRADVKWVRPASIHLTLKFLGDVEEKWIEEVANAVQKATRGTEPFSVSVCGTGTFPNDRRPRVLWIGVEQGVEKLKTLALKIDETLSELGFEKEKRAYSAHLTLGRVRSPNRIASTVESMHTLGFDGGTFDVGEIFVMKSDLKPTGAVYTALKRIKLEG